MYTGIHTLHSPTSRLRTSARRVHTSRGTHSRAPHGSQPNSMSRYSSGHSIEAHSIEIQTLSVLVTDYSQLQLHLQLQLTGGSKQSYQQHSMRSYSLATQHKKPCISVRGCWDPADRVVNMNRCKLRARLIKESWKLRLIYERHELILMRTYQRASTSFPTRRRHL
jgi:hypothetical protein